MSDLDINMEMGGREIAKICLWGLFAVYHQVSPSTWPYFRSYTQRWTMGE